MGGHARHLPVRRGHAVLLIGRASAVFEDWLNQTGLNSKRLQRVSSLKELAQAHRERPEVRRATPLTPCD